MKKLASVLIIIVIVVLLGLWSPWRGISIDIGSIFGINQQESLSGLQIYSLSGTLQIFVDNELKGEVTPETSPNFIDKINPGEHLIRLERKSDIPNSYWNLNKLVNFEKGTNVVISYNIGTEEVFSEGQIIYATKKTDPSKSSQLRVNLSVNGFSTQLDTLPLESVALNEYTTNLDLSRQHTIKLAKNGYESSDFTVLPSTQEDRDKLKDYDLTIEAQLMFQPVNVEDITTSS